VEFQHGPNKLECESWGVHLIREAGDDAEGMLTKRVQALAPEKRERVRAALDAAWTCRKRTTSHESVEHLKSLARGVPSMCEAIPLALLLAVANRPPVGTHR
jgi:hypothetical protein